MGLGAFQLGPRLWRAIAGLGVSQIIGWGSTYYLLTILAEPIGRDLGLSAGMVASGMSVMMVVSAVTGPFAGRLMDVRGAGPVMAAGSAFAAAGLVALSLANGPGTYLAAWGALGAACSMILYPAAFTALTQIAPDRARRSITLLTLPGGLASTVFWPLTSWLLTFQDWRAICLIYAALNIVVCVPLHRFVIPPGGERNAPSNEPNVVIPGLPHALRRKAFVLFTTVLALNAMLVVGLLNQIAVVLNALDHTPEIVIAASMLFGVGQVSARAVEMLVGGRYDPLKGTLLITLGYVVAVAALAAFSPTPAAALVFAAVFGMSNGLFTINRGALVLALFGSEGYGRITGEVTVAQNIAGAAAPVILATVIGGSGIMAGLLAALALALAGAIVMAALFRHATGDSSRLDQGP